MKVIHLIKEVNIIQRMKSLRYSRNKRYRHREFIIEGTAAIEEAFKQHWNIKAVFYNAQCRLSDWAKYHIQKIKVDKCYALTQQLMMKIADKEDCPELIALGESRFLNYENYQPQHPEVIVVVDQPKSAGNLGTIIRSAKAFGVNTLVISGHAADEYDHKCIRSSVGTFFSMTIYRIAGIKDFTKKLNQLQSIYTTHVIASGHQGSEDITQMTCQSDLLFLILGNETKGISEGYRKLADQFVRITLPGPFTSLNIGAAASIFLYEIFQRRNHMQEILGSTNNEMP